MNRSAAQTLIAGKRERLCTRVYLEDGTLLFLDVMFAPPTARSSAGASATNRNQDSVDLEDAE